jgi:(p)ppGpp synthase/HD superfamily hydrolase
MIFTEKIFGAIKFAAKTHQVYRDQKRKGKKIPYITHPLTVALILSLYGASEDEICAGILHDTIEDSNYEKQVTREMIEERFGVVVADLVQSVTDNTKLKSEERKNDILQRISSFTHGSVLVKSADVISNISEILDDHGRFGDEIFERFSENKEKTIEKYLNYSGALINRWPESPMAAQLRQLSERLNKLK